MKDGKWQKNVALFLTSQNISLFGSYLSQCAINWYITLHTKSGLMMGIAIVCGFLPTFFLSPIGGVLADRFSKKKLSILSDVFVASSMLIMSLLLFKEHYSLILLFVLSACRAAGSGIQVPAINSLIPELVPKDNLAKINGINTSLQSMIMLFSPILGGALLAKVPIQYIFFIDIITYIIGIFILAVFVKVVKSNAVKNVEAKSYTADMYEGIVFIRGKGYLGKFFIFYALIYFLATPLVFLTQLQITRDFGTTWWYLPGISMAFCFGMIVGGTIITIKGGFKNRVHTIVLSSFMIGICALLLGFISNVIHVVWLYIFVVAISGLAMPLYNAPATIMLQENIEPSFQGRVFGVLSMISNSVMPIGMLIFGPLADVTKIEYIMIGTSILIVIQSVMLGLSKDIIKAGKPLNTVAVES